MLLTPPHFHFPTYLPVHFITIINTINFFIVFQTEINNDGSFLFSCQHGPIECAANKIHACSISKITNQVLQIKYVSCMISDNIIPELIGEKCAKELLIDWKPISDCSQSDLGNVLLSNYGKVTHSLHPKIDFIPTVLINNVS